MGKNINLGTVVFTPGVAGVGTLNFSGYSGFDGRRLILVTNQTKNTVIYATGTTKGATTIVGNVVTLGVDTSSHSAGDVLQVSYDTDESIYTDTFVSGTLSTTNQWLSVNTQGSYSVAMKATYAGTGALVFEHTVDNGLSWDTVYGVDPDGSGSYATLSGNAEYVFNVGAFHAMRVRATNWTSGNVAITLNSSIAQNLVNAVVFGATNVGQIPTHPPILISGVDPLSAKRTTLVDTDGTTQVNVTKFNGLSASTTNVNGRNRLDVSLAGGHGILSAINGYGNLVGGIDGTLFRPLSTDNTGKLVVNVGTTITQGVSTVNIGKISLDSVNISNLSATHFPVSNAEIIIADTFATFDRTTWVLVTSGGNDIIAAEGNALASSWLTVSLDPLTAGTSTIIESIQTFKIPARASIGLSRSYAALGKEFSIELVSLDTQTAYTPVSVATLQQSGNTALLLSTFSPHGLNVGDTFSIENCVDCRWNYSALTVNSILGVSLLSASGTPIATTLPNTYTANASANTGASIYFRPRLSYAVDGTSMILENTSQTQASYYSRSGGGTAFPMGGTYKDNHSVTINTTASIVAASIPFTYTFQSTTLYDILLKPEYIQYYDKAIDSQALPTIRVKREQNIPNPTKTYKLRITARNNYGLTRPNAKIIKIDKAAGPNCSILTDVPTNFTTADIIVTYGVNDSVNFPNQTTAFPILSVVNSTNFIIASAGTGAFTSYGGYVARINGGNLMSALGTVTQQISSIDRNSNTLRLSSGNGTWTGISIGDYVNIVGCISSTNTSCNIDSAYRVANLVGFILTVEPINNVVSLTGIDIPYTICGGALIKRCDLRLHNLKLTRYDRTITETFGGMSTSDPANANTVYIAGTVSNMSTNIAQWAGQTAIAGGSNGIVAVGGVVAQGAIMGTSTVNPVVVGGADLGGVVRRSLVDLGGGSVGPGEVIGTFGFSAAGASLSATDGVNSKTFIVPAKDSIVYLGLSSLGTANAATFQVEGSYDGQLYSVIPLSRIDNTASAQQYTYAAQFSGVAGAIYKGNTWGYPIIRVHQTSYSGGGNTGVIRVVPNTQVAGQTLSPFTFWAANFAEASGSWAGSIQVGGVRTLAISNKGSNKAILQLDAVTGPMTIALEGSSDFGVSYTALSVQSLGGGVIQTAITFVAPTQITPQGGIFECDASSYTHIRSRCTAYTSGSASGVLKIENSSSNNGLGNNSKSTYAASVYNLSATGATPVFMIESGVSKVTRLKRMVLTSGVATAAVLPLMTIARTTGAGTGFAIGTTPFLPLSALNREVNDPPYTGTVRLSGFNWTGVTSGASFVQIPMPTPITTATTPAMPVVYDFTNGGSEKGLSIPVGVTNGLLFQHAGAAGNVNFGMMLEWTEE